MDSPLVQTASSIFALTFFLDLLELSFKQSVWFLKTLRFWLYFILHLLLSYLAAFLLSNTVSPWYILALVSTFLGVAIISNTDVKIGGQSLVPIAQLFSSIRTEMLAQASDEKGQQLADKIAVAQLFERLHKLPLEKIQLYHHAALIAANYNPKSIVKKVQQAHSISQEEADVKSLLIGQIVKINPQYAEANIAAWEQAGQSLH